MINKVIIGGRLTKDPEMTITSNGQAITRIRIASNWKTKNNTKTVFVDVITFRKNAVTTNKYLKKGSPVLIEGSLSEREFIDQNGMKRRILRIVANRIQFLNKSIQQREDTTLHEEVDETLEPF